MAISNVNNQLICVQPNQNPDQVIAAAADKPPALPHEEAVNYIATLSDNLVVSCATVDPDMNGKYLYDAANDEWVHENGKYKVDKVGTTAYVFIDINTGSTVATSCKNGPNPWKIQYEETNKSLKMIVGQCWEAIAQQIWNPDSCSWATIDYSTLGGGGGTTSGMTRNLDAAGNQLMTHDPGDGSTPLNFSIPFPSSFANPILNKGPVDNPSDLAETIEHISSSGNFTLRQGFSRVETIQDNVGIGAANLGGIGSEWAIRSAARNGDCLNINGAPEHYTVRGRATKGGIGVIIIDGDIDPLAEQDNVELLLTINNLSTKRLLVGKWLSSSGTLNATMWGPEVDAIARFIRMYVEYSQNGSPFNPFTAQIVDMIPINLGGSPLANAVATQSTSLINVPATNSFNDIAPGTSSTLETRIRRFSSAPSTIQNGLKAGEIIYSDGAFIFYQGSTTN